MTPTLPEATTQLDSSSDQPHPINCHLQSSANTSNVSQPPTILLFDISNASSLLPQDPFSLLMTAHHWSNCKRSINQSPSFNFLQISANMPDTYLPSTPPDILHKLWHSNLAPNITTATAVWPSIWQKPNTRNLPIQTVLSPTYYNSKTTTAAIIALNSPESDQSDFALLLLTKWCLPTTLTVPACSSQSHRPSHFTELPHSTATNQIQHDWYYVPWYYQQEQHRIITLLPFHQYMHIKPSTAALHKYPTTEYSIQCSATLIYYMVQVAPALTAITMTAYLLALATKFRTGPRSWITWTYGKHRTETPLPATPDKNLLRPP